MEKVVKKKGSIFVVSAPSGAGKTTLCRALLKKFTEISYSISHTTRTPRTNEVDGKDYFFILESDFQKKIKQGFWVEWAQVHGNYYGTSKTYLSDQTDKGFNILLEIDTKGAKQISRIYPDAVTIFIMPPSLDVLEKRLKGRATDPEHIINTRLDNAKAEIMQKDFYNYVIINGHLEEACERFFKIVKGYL